MMGRMKKMTKCARHTLCFPWSGIEKDETGYYRVWRCGKCSAKAKVRDLDNRPRDQTIIDAFRDELIVEEGE